MPLPKVGEGTYLAVDYSGTPAIATIFDGRWGVLMDDYEVIYVDESDVRPTYWMWISSPK
jgi:hypothetical protein